MRTIYWYLHFVICLVCTLPKLGDVKKRRLSMEQSDFYRLTDEYVSGFARKQISAAGARVHIQGTENIPAERAVLFVSNHQGNFDLAAFLGFVPTPKGYISKAELLKVPILRAWMEYIGCVFMDRSDIKSAARAILEGINTIKSGHSLVVFPEGTRSKGGPVAEFKAGSFKLATKSGAPIVPVTIEGAYKIMEANGNRIKPADIYITVHPPVETAGLDRDEQLTLPERVRGIICSGLRQSG